MKIGCTEIFSQIREYFSNVPAAKGTTQMLWLQALSGVAISFAKTAKISWSLALIAKYLRIRGNPETEITKKCFRFERDNLKKSWTIRKMRMQAKRISEDVWNRMACIRWFSLILISFTNVQAAMAITTKTTASLI